ncbi:MAG: glucose-6-phosphate isomerase, partial [Candidatus Pelagibacter sp.]
MTKIIDSAEWKALEKHYNEIKNTEMRDLFDDDKDRFDKFHLNLDDFLVDFSKNRITKTTSKLLNDLAGKVKIDEWKKKQFSGEKINNTENRAV